MRNSKAHALVAAALLAGAAFPAAAQQAQSTAAQQVQPTLPRTDMTGWMEYDQLTVEPFGLRARQMDGMDVYGADGDEIGEIEELLVDASGKFVAVVIEVDRYLGLVDREVVVGLDQLQRAGDRFALNMTEEQLEQLPEWDDVDD